MTGYNNFIEKIINFKIFDINLFVDFIQDYSKLEKNQNQNRLFYLLLNSMIYYISQIERYDIHYQDKLVRINKDGIILKNIKESELVEGSHTNEDNESFSLNFLFVDIRGLREELNILKIYFFYIIFNCKPIQDEIPSIQIEKKNLYRIILEFIYYTNHQYLNLLASITNKSIPNIVNIFIQFGFLDQHDFLPLNRERNPFY